MLSVDECQELLGNTGLTDKQVKELRNTLYALVERTIDGYIDDVARQMKEELQEQKNMPAEYVCELYERLEEQGIPIWIDGGWAVDALLGEKTREHGDLDIALEHKYVLPMRDYLESRGYSEVKRDDASQWNFVMEDESGHQVDFHSFVLDDSGKLIDGIKYPEGSLTGTGKILNLEVRTIDPEHMVSFLAPWVHKWPEKYLPAIAVLCKRYEIPLPPEYHTANSAEV